MLTHVVVDGSNLATEGRSLPSLDQLNRAVLDYRAENPDTEIIVIVDATFGHRIDASERPLFEDAIVHQELVAPPAGAIGRGDAFVLRIAEKIGATVLSNDSFQEFHAEHEWLFAPGRLVGGKPIPGVGWIFTPRTPVRGPKSREVTSNAKRKRKGSALPDAPQVSGAELVEKGKAAMSKLPKAARTRPMGEVDKAIAAATVEAVDPDLEGGGKRRKRRRKSAAIPAEPLNIPGDFLRFVADHRPGDTIVGTVDQFSSHGAFVECEGLRCYVPLTLMATPAPRAAREVLGKGESREFVIRAYDAARRGIELMLPGVDAPIGPVTDDTVAAEVGDDTIEADKPTSKPKPQAKPQAKPQRRKPQAKPAGEQASTLEAVEAPVEKPAAAKKASPVKKAAAKKAAPAKKAAVKKAAVKKAAVKKAAVKKAAVEKVAATKAAVATKAPAKDAAVKKAAVKKAAAVKAPAKKAAVKKAAVKKAAVKKAAPPAN